MRLNILLFHYLFGSLALLLAKLPVSFISKRRSFEIKNKNDIYAVSFRVDSLRACVCIHFSSEGEFQQIRPLIEKLLNERYLVELIYTSPSVEASVIKLQQEYSTWYLRTLRLPILSPFIVNDWVSSDNLIMVRYDFFPMLLNLGLRKENFILYSATLKSSNTFSKFIKNQVFSLFTGLIPATEKDASIMMNSFHSQIFDFMDLRALSIKERQTKGLVNNEYFKTLKEFINQYHHKIILAQFWPAEASVFNRKLIKAVSNGALVYLAPHSLAKENLEKIIEEVSKFCDLKPVILERDISLSDLENKLHGFETESHYLISLIPGMLCELYPYFTQAFVGGGHGKGIHSVLEPYIAGLRIFVGPHVTRSTEFDLLVEQSADIQVMEDLSHTDFLQEINAANMDISHYLEHNDKQLDLLANLIIKAN